MAKRANGEGSVRQRADGKWESRISYRDDAGRLVRRSFYASTQREARAKAKTALQRLDRALPVVDARTTLAAWVEQWERTSFEASDRKPATKTLYRQLARTHIVPALGALSLGQIRPHHVDSLTLALRSAGKSDSTIRTTYTVLRSILAAAVTSKLIADNPAAAVARPKVEHIEARHLSSDEVRAILKAAEGTRWHGPIALIALTGIRRGEALAARWGDIDLEAGVLRVRGTLRRTPEGYDITSPKTANSRRDVTLTASAIEVLRARRLAQKEERLRAGSVWSDDARFNDLVFTDGAGQPIDPRALYHGFTRFVRGAVADPAGVGLHTLRHSAATSMLEAGVPLHVVSRILGHSSVAITGDIYGHVTDSRQRDAMDSLSAALGL